jgi:hypothetical protein
MRQHKPNLSVLLGILLSICIVLLAANYWRLSQPPRPDPRIVALAVRATMFAVPTATPRIVEVTRVVEVTALPPTATATVTATVTPPSTPLSAPLSAPLPPEGAAPVPRTLSESLPDNTIAVAAVPTEEVPVAKASQLETGVVELSTEEAFEQESAPAEQEPAELAPASVSCPGGSDASYTTVPTAGGGLTHPDSLHADLNLAVRGYSPTDVGAGLIDKDGPVDGDPPQLAGIFADYRRPAFGQAYRVNDWDWNCSERGCPLGPLDHVGATLLTVAANAGEPLGIPHRNAQIYGGGYKALVLYAESTRITLGYTRDDSVANGYAVHLENVCVNPGLVALYQGSNAAGRSFLPALREDEVLGTASGGAILVAVRDRGVFFDPRSRLDWWQEFSAEP